MVTDAGDIVLAEITTATANWVVWRETRVRRIRSTNRSSAAIRAVHTLPDTDRS